MDVQSTLSTSGDLRGSMVLKYGDGLAPGVRPSLREDKGDLDRLLTLRGLLVGPQPASEPEEPEPVRLRNRLVLLVELVAVVAAGPVIIHACFGCRICP